MIFNRTHPFPAKIKERCLLTKNGSTKSTYHITLDIAGSGLSYKVGDSLGIYAPNDPIFVQRILHALRLDPLTPVMHPRSGHPFLLKEYLLTQANLARVTPPLLHLFGNSSHIDQWSSQDLLDVALQLSIKAFDLPAFLAALPPLLPRFYSVASSPYLYADEVHLLVTLSSFYHGEELRYGVASHFLCHRAEIDQTSIPCYVQPTTHFTLPSNPDVPIIMVGPGTGVAPFRGFLQERLHHHATGKNWLFFGERNQQTDFLYEEFWKDLSQKNKLILDVAFSRDQTTKLYVQHKLLEKGETIWGWLEEGASFYVCGDADPMAKEVQAALLQICQTHGRHAQDAAQNYLKKLRQQKRYLADVY